MNTNLVSVVMPVYNEASTVAAVLDDLLSRRFEEFEIEIIVVESNSSDGTREIVENYRANSHVKLVLQAEPKGKGAAVREGLPAAAGNIVLIQDADLEYSIDDYPKLVEPILSGAADVVLGSRAHRDGPIREMRGEAVSSYLTNFGHWVFTALFNVLYGQRLKDPFTMFKVFKIECIEGLTFDSERFDFDWELLGKICRRGHTPLEIPVSYQARGFNAGKKVRWIRDPLTWIKAALKYRLVKI